jgi:UDP-glucose 4-epimerase
LKNKSILVTGGFGFIGKPLCEKLLEKNCEITILEKSKKIPDQFQSLKNLKIIIGNTQEKKLEKKIRGDFDYIFHFGAPSSIVQFKNKEFEMLGDSLLGFLNVMKLAENLSVNKVVYPSSGSVYGYSKPPQKEKSALMTTNLYGVGKIGCENIASVYNKIDSVGLRIFAGYGPDENHKKEYASPLSLFYKSISKNKPPLVFGNGKQSRDFVYIDDIVKCIISSAERKTPKILNIGSGKSHTFIEVIQKINQHLQKKIEPKFVEKPENYLENTRADTSLMKKYLKVKPLNLDEGLKLYLAKKIN